MYRSKYSSQPPLAAWDDMLEAVTWRSSESELDLLLGIWPNMKLGSIRLK